MIICIVAINAFQGYWLLTTYRLNRSQFRQTVQEALFQVVEGEQIARADALFGLNGRKLGAPGAPPLSQSRMIVRKFKSGPNAETRLYVRSDIEDKTVKVAPGDTLANRISRMLVMGWAEGGQIDKRKLFSAYRLELQKRGVQAAFLIDTLRIIPESNGDKTYFVDKRDSGFNVSNQFRTFPVPINPVKNLFVQATFDMPFSFLFKKMGGLLVASFLLLTLTTGCFVYMLHTILRQKRLSEIKNDFINNMTHELKTPIATVTAAVEAMMNYGVLDHPEKAKSYLSISQNNLGRLSELVEKVLNLAVEDKQEMTLHREPVNLRQLIGEITEGYKLKATKQVHFEHQIADNEVVSVDPIHFANVLSNLVDNAVKYSNEAVTVIFKYKNDGNSWQLAVADNGIGIAKNHQQAVFERFFRVPTGNLHAVKGFGLGLAYVRQVVERHGGSVYVVSEPGKGSEFILKF
ncbi:cell wall metabolism sensor histidine kinase WalK [Dyadobacter sp. CY326]|uniref:sensor histidine kinase n=1 Tax=Dyadobacter sp. CY326 TaxID=2907300 RepID=UPI001F340390|nr:HAMP domain-containing sensor histidine kinase [Dyadobacter sp. CY326]MCE7067089.1 HAMP domain-containing histidine kinase [Dyadobacter sp. CY326]